MLKVGSDGASVSTSGTTILMFSATATVLLNLNSTRGETGLSGLVDVSAMNRSSACTHCKMCVHVYVCIQICIDDMCIYTHTYIYIHTYVHTLMHRGLCMHMYVHTYVHTIACVQNPCTHIYIHACRFFEHALMYEYASTTKRC